MLYTKWPYSALLDFATSQSFTPFVKLEKDYTPGKCGTVPYTSGTRILEPRAIRFFGRFCPPRISLGHGQYWTASDIGFGVSLIKRQHKLLSKSKILMFSPGLVHTAQRSTNPNLFSSSSRGCHMLMLYVVQYHKIYYSKLYKLHIHAKGSVPLRRTRSLGFGVSAAHGSSTPRRGACAHALTPLTRQTERRTTTRPPGKCGLVTMCWSSLPLCPHHGWSTIAARSPSKSVSIRT